MNNVSGNELNGTIIGDPNFVEGHDGMTLDLDGVDDYVDRGYDSLFDILTNEMTVSAWVTIESIANQWAVIAAKGEYAWRLGNVNWDPRFCFGISVWNAPDKLTNKTKEKFKELVGAFVRHYPHVLSRRVTVKIPDQRLELP